MKEDLTKVDLADDLQNRHIRLVAGENRHGHQLRIHAPELLQGGRREDQSRRTDTLRHTPPYAESRPLEVREVELQPPGRGEVLIRVAAAGVCHSDLSVIDGTRPRPIPMVLGHEASGYVEACGEGVEDLKPGDQVVCIFAPGCGGCGPCAEGRPALCEPAAQRSGAGELLTGERRLSLGEIPVNHHVGVSAFAEYAVVARQSILKV